uniref:BEACH domain-containing protein n=1 Tax=Arcella intermedia TaxID=1963864 RepID=A0A6B2KY56_9EUKA
MIGEHRLYFIDEHEFQDQEEEKRKITSVRHNFTVDYEYIKEIHNRRYLLKNIALEIFLTTGKTYFLAFMTETDRNKTYEKLLKMELPNLTREAETLLSPSMLSPSITQKWQKGLITNFEYLMILNTLSERTFNDLTQYPVLPFVLADYISEKLNLSEESTFRDLSKPMGAQNPERLERFWEKYRMLETMKEKPYLYGSHYSNMGSVLHFLIRMEPFSRYLIEFQGGKFDVPDRIFFSLAQAWDLSSKTSNSDVKELIPEFFTIPEFLVNDNKFDLGKTQNRKSVSEVELPVWAHNSPRTFIFNHMEALESDYVSSQLHLWIDLIFGSKQRGVEALEASNAFHPLTYEGSVNVEQIQDPLEKAAAIAQINSFGQTPKQIFFKPHPKRFPKESHMKMNIASHPEQIVSRRPLKLSKAIYGLSYVENEIVILGPNRTVFWEKHFKGKPRILQWGNWDGTLRVVSMKDDQVILSLDGLAIQLDTINCADVSQDGTIIACGFKSSLVRLWMKRPRYIKKFQRQQQIKMKQQVEHLKRTSELSAATMKTSGGIPRYDPLDSPRSPSSPSKQKFGGFTQSNNVAKTVIEIEFVGSLDGHQDEVKCIRVCNQHAIAVSGSADGTCIIWDISRRKLLRSLGPHNGPIIALDVEMYWGDIVVVDDPGKEVGNIHLWSINGSPIAQKRLKPRALCVAFTKLKPGLGKNIIITGHSNGEIHLWSAFDLTPLHIIKGTHQFPVCSLAVKEDNMEFTSGDVSGSTITHELRYE